MAKRPSELQEGESIKVKRGETEILFVREYGALHVTIGPPERHTNIAEEQAYHDSLINVYFKTETETDSFHEAIIQSAGRE